MGRVPIFLSHNQHFDCPLLLFILFLKHSKAKNREKALQPESEDQLPPSLHFLANYLWINTEEPHKTLMDLSFSAQTRLVWSNS